MDNELDREVESNKPEKLERTSPASFRNPAWIWLLPVLLFFILFFVVSCCVKDTVKNSYMYTQEYYLRDYAAYGQYCYTHPQPCPTYSEWELVHGSPSPDNGRTADALVTFLSILVTLVLSYMVIFPLGLYFIVLGKKFLGEDRFVDPTEKLSYRMDTSWISHWIRRLIYGIEFVSFLVGFFLGRLVFPLPGFVSKLPVAVSSVLINCLYGGLFAFMGFIIGSLLLGLISVLLVKKIRKPEKS